MVTENAAQKFVDHFAKLCNTATPNHTCIDKAGEEFLAIHVGAITDFYAGALATTRKELADTNDYASRVFLKPTAPKVWLKSIEVQRLQKIFTESLTVGKATLGSDFFEKFIPFLGGIEHRIYSDANHIVFGRRGAGKSSLVLFACHHALREDRPFTWIALQQYRGREDLVVIPQVLHEIVASVSAYPGAESERVERLQNLVTALEGKGDDLTKKDINQSLPKFARDFLPFVKKHERFYIFLDDLHLIHPNLQPYFLSSLYSFSRGNNVYLKITSIENLTKLQGDVENEGLQTPGDAQVIRLDYNLVDPGAALTHTENIIDSYVKYVGVPSISRLVGANVLERLVWVSAGVPRDALYIFNNAILKALSAGRKRVAVTDINMAAADSLTEKQQSISDDVAVDDRSVMEVVHDIKDFCLKDIRLNAFLIRLENSDPRYQLIRKISDLRFIHVLHPGITPERAGEKYEVYMLDYAFYTGFRKAPSVKEFMQTPTLPSAKELRKLERYPYAQRLKLD